MRLRLGEYTDSGGRPRQIIGIDGAGGSVLVIDRDAVTHGDDRLLAHLAADEPIENASLVSRGYLGEGVVRCIRPRRVVARDFHAAPLDDEDDDEPERAPLVIDAPELDRAGHAYRLEPVRGSLCIPELRWRRLPPSAVAADASIVSVREAVARLESYEPICALTRRTLRAHRQTRQLSTAVLRLEVQRLQRSPIVLNRGLREAVIAATERHGLSMSEIAMRCGRIKYDRAGNASGETSWLARRLGILPEGGQQAPTPWIHSDVLALIARRGLGVSPREVELD
ncbi:MAG: hypothetical protein E6G34_03015 [Actinobacteria bacterium]|nr:MAG: hypothetical protein E6G34_03015 [Actinomycetota bacterium]